MTEKQIIKKWFSNENYYNSDIIRNMQTESGHKCDIALIYSGRNRGKSFDISAKAILEAWNSKGSKTFGYIRRYDKEIQNYKVEDYFCDKIEFLKNITNNKCDCFICERGKIYVGKINIDGGKIKRDKILQVGNTFALNLAVQYKSLQYPSIHTLIFEEVFANDYITDEPNKLLSIISTVKRNKDDFIVFLISNLVSKINPYTQGFSLRGILKQKSGTIDEYRLYKGTLDNKGNEDYYYICCEYLKDNENVEASKSKKSKNRKIVSNTSNKWEEAQIYPCISQNYIRKYETIYKCVFEYNDFKYLCELKIVPINLQEMYNTLIDSDVEIEPITEYMEVCFISRKTSKVTNDIRLFTNNPTVLPFATRGYYILNDYDELIDKLITMGHTFYADNLTANEFNQSIEEIKRF